LALVNRSLILSHDQQAHRQVFALRASFEQCLQTFILPVIANEQQNEFFRRAFPFQAISFTQR
jgi:hypothetical protein